ncbi:MAG: AbrB/MazE/SpoVT family DNA-binding domain-containing protein [Patescibacteria group bacterium]
MQTTFEEIIKIQPRGVFTIPKKLRINLGISDNSLVRLKEERGRLLIEPVRTLPYPVRSYTKQDIDEFIEFDQKLTKTLKAKGIL